MSREDEKLRVKKIRFVGLNVSLLLTITMQSILCMILVWNS